MDCNEKNCQSLLGFHVIMLCMCVTGRGVRNIWRTTSYSTAWLCCSIFSIAYVWNAM